MIQLAPDLTPHQGEFNTTNELLEVVGAGANSVPSGRILWKQKSAVTVAFLYVQSTAKSVNTKCQQQ